jgi:hypothetical protein
MRQRLRSHLTYANVMVTLLAFIVLTGGTAVALSGSNTVFTDDITNDTEPAGGGNPAGGLAAVDLRPNSVGTSEISNGQVSVLDTNKVIPSGATVTGVLQGFEDDNEGGGIADFEEAVDFHGLRAPAALTDADVGFDDAGVSAAAADNGEENAGCTGGIFNPTAPSGKVCIYLFSEDVADNGAFGFRLGQGTGFTQADRHGFRVVAGNNSGFAELRGTWAYRAP